MPNLRRLLVLLIVLAVVALSVTVWRKISQQSPEELLAALPKQIDLSLDQLHYTQNENGQRSWTLDADKAEYQREQSQAILDNVRLQFYRAGESGDIQLEAEHGFLQQETRQIEVWGQVVVRTARGEQLFTERLHYNDQKRQLTTKEPIRMLAKQMELTGTGLQLDIDDGRLEVKNNVWMLLLPASREKHHD
jgi:LPS export ABC transporter protein LptC